MTCTIHRDLDGIPIAIAVEDGLGLPVVCPMNAPYDVYRNGNKVEACVGYDRDAGSVWINTGRIIGNEWEIARLTGTVTVEPIDLGA